MHDAPLPAANVILAMGPVRNPEVRANDGAEPSNLRILAIAYPLRA